MENGRKSESKQKKKTWKIESKNDAFLDEKMSQTIIKNSSKMEAEMDQKCVRFRVWPALASFGLFSPPFGLLWALLGLPLGLPWGSLGLLWGLLSLPWASLGPPLRSFGIPLARLGPHWALLGPPLGSLWTFWAPDGLPLSLPLSKCAPLSNESSVFEKSGF